MKTKGDCMNIFLRYLDEATKKGVDLPITKNADYRDKFNYFLDLAQKYVAGIVKIPASFQVTQFPIDNLLGNGQGFEMKQYKPGEDITLTVTGAKSYYFEMDNIGTVVILVNGIQVMTIDNTTKKSFTAYKGNITPTPGDNDIVELIFTGSYLYNYRNVALYQYAFPEDSDVPDYTPYLTYDMPSNFMSFDNIINKTDPKVYEAFVNYKWENNKKVILSYDDKGSFDIHYFKYPADISTDASDDTVLEIEDKAIDLVVLQAGIKATAADNEELSRYLQNLYDREIARVEDNNRISETRVQTIYYMM